MEPNWRIHWHLPWIWTNAGNYKRSRINHFLTLNNLYTLQRVMYVTMRVISLGPKSSKRNLFLDQG